MFIQSTEQFRQDINAVLDAATRAGGLAILPAVTRVIDACNRARPMVDEAVADKQREDAVEEALRAASEEASHDDASASAGAVDAAAPAAEASTAS